ncbi:unnamed protein product [Musa acuminata subsp. malaccensis]|uniref:(wild Malaysian banana) hypothetical protein n=1 Tax=Musa acuminata subsp. malaccensis TaxID=214687 RepID=A0A804ID27_MUSAM|nr:unnamed protein product [Musa acuminata subsp. malaccensis]
MQHHRRNHPVIWHHIFSATHLAFSAMVGPLCMAQFDTTKCG